MVERDGMASVRACLTSVLAAPESLPAMPAGELDRTLRLLRRARLLGRVAQQLVDRGVEPGCWPAQALAQLDSARVMAEARGRLARWELDRLAWALDDLPASVPLVVMKGCAYLLAGTPNARGRMFADVDLLVPEAELPGIERRLRKRGWQMAELTPYDERYYRFWTHELPPLTHAERSVEVDLHHNLLMRTARLKPSPSLLFEAARSVPRLRYRTLAPIDMVLQAMVHLFYGSELDGSLRELVDIDDLVRHYAVTEPGFWGQFWPRVEALDLARPAFFGLRYASRLLGTPVPGDVLAASAAGAPPSAVLWLMDGIVERSLFPQPLARRDRVGSVARLLAYVRSHYVKMPPGLLARHLLVKARSRVRSGARR